MTKSDHIAIQERLRPKRERQVYDTKTSFSKLIMKTFEPHISTALVMAVHYIYVSKMH